MITGVCLNDPKKKQKGERKRDPNKHTNQHPNPHNKNPPKAKNNTPPPKRRPKAKKMTKSASYNGVQSMGEN